MKLWKRNAVVAAIVLFVCAAVYLNWSYTQEETADTGKVLGEAALVGGQSTDPLLEGAEPSPSPTATASAPAGGGEEEGSGYFANARLNRQQARDSALSLLQEAAADANASQTAVEEANAAIQTMADYTLSEANIENLVTAKGYQDCVAFLNENSISVVVDNSGAPLAEADIAKISEIVTEETGLTASQIKIIEAS
ncbi:MAG TPA: SpoIIIAH-like family protein [Candidatus Intestinimonas stercoravium]|uniref:SpoIIIAH-like family protein n=1 Tax=uncultured Intestinimonas sp. TaxID=1689265 RepID=UPI001F8A6991|nr:SpoIIIAH-like family protein [uncultured Intestinimonas sp.]HJA63361.1 SpoIIIAH-like family protein [Candidatus Intestinimonas stercoravium]